MAYISCHDPATGLGRLRLVEHASRATPVASAGANNEQLLQQRTIWPNAIHGQRDPSGERTLRIVAS
jgi:hypothetical protein